MPFAVACRAMCMKWLGRTHVGRVCDEKSVLVASVYTLLTVVARSSRAVDEEVH